MIREFKDIPENKISKLIDLIKNKVVQQENEVGEFYQIINNFFNNIEENNLFVVVAYMVNNTNDIVIEIVYVQSFSEITNNILDTMNNIKDFQKEILIKS